MEIKLLFFFILCMLGGCLGSSYDDTVKVNKLISVIAKENNIYQEPDKERCMDMFYTEPSINIISHGSPISLFQDSIFSKRFYSGWLYEGDTLKIGINLIEADYEILILASILGEAVNIETRIEVEEDLFSSNIKGGVLTSIKKVALTSNCNNFELSEIPDSTDEGRIYGLIDLETEYFFSTKRDSLVYAKLEMHTFFQAKKACR